MPPQYPSLSFEHGDAQSIIYLQSKIATAKANLFELGGLENGYTAVLKAAAGTGKTTFISKLFGVSEKELAGKFIEYYVPNHALSEQVERDIRQWFESFRIRLGDHPDTIQTNVIKGYSGRDSFGEHYCRKHLEAKKLMDYGMSVKFHLCGNKKAHCAWYDSCQYRKQFNGMKAVKKQARHYRFPIVNVLAHNHLFLNKREDLPRPSLIIIDESFYQRGIAEYVVDPDELRKKGTKISRLIHSCLMYGDPILKALREEDITPDDLLAESWLLGDEDPSISPITPFEKQIKMLESLPSPTYVDKLLQALAYELQTVDREDSYVAELGPVKRGNTISDVIKVHIRKPMTIPGDVPTLIIDADANRRIVETFRPVDDFVSVQVDRHAKVHQFYSHTFSLHSLSNTNPELQDQVKRLVHLIADQGKTLVATTRKIRCLLTGEKNDPSLPRIGMLGEASVVHFGMLRGLNDFKDFDNVVIVGREEPNAATMESQAKALWWDHDAPLELIAEEDNNNYVTVRRGYRMRSESPESVMTRVHPDRRVQDLLEQARECEITQAIDRLRLVRPKEIETEEGTEAVTRRVYLLTSIPVDITVDHLWDWKRLQEFLEIWDRTDGVIPLGTDELLSLLPSINAESSAKDAARRLKGMLKLISSIISPDVPLVCSYKVEKSSKGQAAKAIISSRHLEPRSALEGWLGKSVEFFHVSEA